MSCFVVPLVQAAVTSAIRAHGGVRRDSFLGRYLPDLEKMLWGGTIMLIVDHVINGELTWRFPFFTALGQTGGFSVMLKEILTVGVPMSVVITVAWLILAALKERRRAAATVK